MPTAIADGPFSVGSGGTIYAGRPGGTPSWAVGAPLNAWIAIPGTAGTTLGWAVDAWGGFPLRDDGDGLVQAVFLAGGGHTNSSDNYVFSIDFSSSSPTIKTRVQKSLIPFDEATEGAFQTQTNYYSWDVVKGDNPKPGSSHLYDYVYWNKYSQKYVRVSATGTYSSGGTSACVDTISPVGTTWTWDPPNTNPNFPYSGNGASQARGNPADGYIWASGYKWRPGQASWTAQTTYQNSGTTWRFPFAYDAGRDCIFQVQYGDGQNRGALSGGGRDDVFRAKQTFLTGAPRAISFSASSALTKIMADMPDYAGMDYDSYNGYYLFMYDNAGVPNFQGLFKITPAAANAATGWTIEEFALGAGGVTPGRTPPDGSGVNGRLKYSPTLGGFIYWPKSTSGAYFMRTK